MIKVTLEFTTIYAAAAALMTLREAGHDAAIPADDKLAQPAAAVTGKQEPALAPAPTAAPSPAPAAAPKAEASAPSASTEKPSASPAQAASAATTTTGEALSYEKDVKPVVIKVGAAGKRDALVELLKKFGVAKGPEVPADKLPAFKSELEALLA